VNYPHLKIWVFPAGMPKCSLLTLRGTMNNVKDLSALSERRPVARI